MLKPIFPRAPLKVWIHFSSVKCEKRTVTQYRAVIDKNKLYPYDTFGLNLLGKGSKNKEVIW
jgi:hypothetical protein